MRWNAGGALVVESGVRESRDLAATIVFRTADPVSSIGSRVDCM